MVQACRGRLPSLAVEPVAVVEVGPVVLVHLQLWQTLTFAHVQDVVADELRRAQDGAARVQPLVDGLRVVVLTKLHHDEVHVVTQSVEEPTQCVTSPLAGALQECVHLTNEELVRLPDRRQSFGVGRLERARASCDHRGAESVPIGKRRCQFRPAVAAGEFPGPCREVGEPAASGDVPDRGQQEQQGDQPLLAIHDVERAGPARVTVRPALEHNGAEKVLRPAGTVGGRAQVIPELAPLIGGPDIVPLKWRDNEPDAATEQLAKVALVRVVHDRSPDCSARQAANDDDVKWQGWQMHAAARGHRPGQQWRPYGGAAQAARPTQP